MSIINSKSNHKYPSPDPYIMCSSPLLSFLCGFFAALLLRRCYECAFRSLFVMFMHYVAQCNVKKVLPVEFLSVGGGRRGRGMVWADSNYSQCLVVSLGLAGYAQSSQVTLTF